MSHVFFFLKCDTHLCILYHNSTNDVLNHLRLRNPTLMSNWTTEKGSSSGNEMQCMKYLSYVSREIQNKIRL